LPHISAILSLIVLPWVIYKIPFLKRMLLYLYGIKE
jgi:hypothetical protein